MYGQYFNDTFFPTATVQNSFMTDADHMLIQEMHRNTVSILDK